MLTLDDQVSAISKIMGHKKSKNHQGTKRPKELVRHIWTMDEELLAIKLYKAKATKPEIAFAIKDLRMTAASMNMKLKNLAYLDTGKGLENVSEMTRTLWEKSL